MDNTKGHPAIPLSGGAFELSDLTEKVEAAVRQPDAERDAAIAQAMDDANKAERPGKGEVVEGYRIGKVKGQDGNTYNALVSIKPTGAETEDDSNTGSNTPPSPPAGGRGQK